MIERARLESLLAGFGQLTIGLVGDLFLDRYLEIDPDLSEPSIETGLEAYQVTRIRNQPGALGTVLNNLAALGVGRLLPVTVLGDDGQAYDLLRELGQLGVDTTHVIKDPARLTPTYTKPLRRNADGTWSELNRLDLRNTSPLDEATLERLAAVLSRVFREVDGLIVLDQVNEESAGVVGPAVRDLLARLSKEQPEKLIFIDSRRYIQSFRCGTLKANAVECLRAVGGVEAELSQQVLDPDAGPAAAETLSARTGLPVYCTLGDRGILVVRPGEASELVPGYLVEGPIDIVGAGDSSTAAMVASLLAGGTSIEAAVVGNLAASITVQQLGTTGTASPAQVLERWRQTHE